MKQINGMSFDIARRWWGTNINKEQMEIDVVAESANKKHLLVGECKWSKIKDTTSILRELELKAKLLPFAGERKIIPVVYIKQTTGDNVPANVFLPSDVLDRLR